MRYTHEMDTQEMHAYEVHAYEVHQWSRSKGAEFHNVRGYQESIQLSGAYATRQTS
jgi:hypothetical protein